MPTPEEIAAQAAQTTETVVPPASEKPATETTTEIFDQARAMALIEKLRQENKDLGKTAKRVQEFEAAEAKRKEAEMTELQKAQKQLSDLQEALNGERHARLQSEVAAKAGLPAALANRLMGETAEELEADAKAIKELLAAQPGQKPNSTGIVTNPGSNGATGETREAKRARLGI